MCEGMNPPKPLSRGTPSPLPGTPQQPPARLPCLRRPPNSDRPACFSAESQTASHHSCVYELQSAFASASAPAPTQGRCMRPFTPVGLAPAAAGGSAPGRPTCLDHHTHWEAFSKCPAPTDPGGLAEPSSRTSALRLHRNGPACSVSP